MKRLMVLMVIAVVSASTVGCCRPLLWRFRCCQQQSACDTMPMYDSSFVPLVPAPGGSAPMTVVPGG